MKEETVEEVRKFYQHLDRHCEVLALTLDAFRKAINEFADNETRKKIEDQLSLEVSRILNGVRDPKAPDLTKCPKKGR